MNLDLHKRRHHTSVVWLALCSVLGVGTAVVGVAPTAQAAATGTLTIPDTIYVGEPFVVQVANVTDSAGGVVDIEIKCPDQPRPGAPTGPSVTCVVSKPGTVSISVNLWSQGSTPRLIGGLFAQASAVSRLPYATFAPVTNSVSEGVGAFARVTVTLDRPTPTPVSIDVDVISGGSAPLIPGLDYVEPTDRTVRFATGAQASDFVVELLDDDIFEYGDSLIFALSNPSEGLAIYSPRSARVNISDNDPRPMITMSSATTSLLEGDLGTETAVEVSFSATGTSDLPMSVVVNDRTNQPTLRGYRWRQLATIPPGSTSATNTLMIVGDGIVETDEVIELEMYNAGFSQSIFVTVLNDDRPLDLTVGFPSEVITEDPRELPVTVSSNAVLPIYVEVDNEGDGHFDWSASDISELAFDVPWAVGDDRVGPFSPTIRVTDSKGATGILRSTPIAVANSAPTGSLAGLQGPAPYGITVSNLRDGSLQHHDEIVAVRVRCGSGAWRDAEISGPTAWASCGDDVHARSMWIEAELTDDQGAVRNLREFTRAKNVEAPFTVSSDGRLTSRVDEGAEVVLTGGPTNAVGWQIDYWEVLWDDNGDGEPTLQADGVEANLTFTAPAYLINDASVGPIIVRRTVSSPTHQTSTVTQIVVTNRLPTGNLTLERDAESGHVIATVSDVLDMTGPRVEVTIDCGNGDRDTQHLLAGPDSFESWPRDCGALRSGDRVTAWLVDAGGARTILRAVVD